MLDPKTNRLDYGTLLMPPPGYELTHAVASTYSLDLYTLLAIPVALFYSKVLDGRFEATRFDVLESIQKTAGILDIYCQKGKIKMPSKFNWLFAYVEDAVHEVTPSDHLSSFHPKIWLLRFEKGQQIQYRFIILSRNLTFDRSWDLAMHVDGTLTKRTYEANRHLVEFVKYLHQRHQTKGVKAILNELSCVKFEEIERFKNLAFHPIGIDGYQTYKNPLENRSFDEMLIISPFVDRTTLKMLHQNCPGTKVLLSREEELQKIPPSILEGYAPYFLSRRIVEGEAFEELDETDLEPQRQQLHAKLFICRRQHRIFWFLGSANCTDPAFTRNTEFMVALEGDHESAGLDRIKNLLIDAEDASVFFEPYEAVEPSLDNESDRVRHLLRKLSYDLINTKFVGKLVPKEGTPNFDLLLSADTQKISWEKEFVVKIAPLNLGHDSRRIRPLVINDLRFENISEVELSIFTMVTISFKGETAASFLVKMQFDLPATRKDRILKSLISSRENFLNYLNFLLSDNPYLDNTILTDPKDPREPPEPPTRKNSAENHPIFEHLLITASRCPNKLKSINRLIQRLTDDDDNNPERIIPENFLEFWKVFKQVAGIK